MLPDVLFMSRKSWETFSDSERALLREAARASVTFMRRRWEAWNQAARKQAIAEGVTIIEDVDRAGFENALKDLRGGILKSPGVRELGVHIDALK